GVALCVGQQRPHVGAAAQRGGRLARVVADDDQDRRRRSLHGYGAGSASREKRRSRTPNESGGSSSTRKSRQRSASSISPIAPAAVIRAGTVRGVAGVGSWGQGCAGWPRSSGRG